MHAGLNVRRLMVCSRPLQRLHQRRPAVRSAAAVPARLDAMPRAMRPGRFELPTCGLGNRSKVHSSVGSEVSGRAPGRAMGSPMDPFDASVDQSADRHLAGIISAWPHLSETIKSAVFTIVELGRTASSAIIKAECTKKGPGPT